MVSIREIQSGIVEEEENKANSENASVTQSDNFLDAVNIKDSSAADLDKRFFSGATDNPNELRNDIDNAIGYRTFKSYYDRYVEDETKFNPNAKLMNKVDFQKLADEGTLEDSDGTIIKDVNSSPFVAFAEGMTYEDKIKVMANNRAKQIETADAIADLPVNRLLTQFAEPVKDKKDPIRLPKGKPFYTDLEGNKVELEERPLFGNVGEEGKIVYDYENPALLFKNFLDKKTNLNEYQKSMLIKAQATEGFMDTDKSLESFRTVNYTKDIGRMVGNASLFMIEAGVNTFGDLLKGADDEETPEWMKSMRLPDTHIDYGSEIFAQRTGIDVETAERILDWSPDFVAPIKREFVAGLPIAGVLSIGRLGGVMLRDSGFRRHIKNKFGGKTFDEAFEIGMKQGENYDSMLTSYAETGFNSPFLNSWKKSATIEAINSQGVMKNYFRKVDTTDIDNMIKELSTDVELLSERRVKNPKFNEAWIKKSDELLLLKKKKSNMHLTARIPFKFLNAVKTEGFPAIGVGLSKHTHQEYFEDQNETMFEFGGVALGLYGEKVLRGPAAGMRSILNGTYRFGGISGANKRIAEDFVGNLYAKSPDLAQTFENGVEATLSLERRLLSLKDVKGNPIINSPDIISKTIENIGVLNILKQTSSSANNSIKAGDAMNFSKKFVDLQTKLIDQKGLNEELADAVNKLNVAATSPNITEADLSFIKGLNRYAKDSQTSLQKEIDEFYTNIDDSTALLMLRASGADVAGGKLEDTGQLLRTLNMSRKQMDIALGKTSDQITEEMNQRLLTFDQAILDLTRKTENSKRIVTKDMTKITSLAFNYIKEGKYQRASNGFNKLREQNKNAFMDVSNVFETMTKDDSVISGSDAAKKIGGIKLSAIQESDMGNVLNNAADNFFNQRPELTDAVNALKEEYPNATSLEIWSALKQEAVAKGSDVMKLPLNFVDFELVASGLSSAVYKGKGNRKVLPVKEIRKALFDAAEDQNTGFKVGFFDDSGGVPVNQQVMSDYKKVKGVYMDYAERYDTGTLGGNWTNTIASKSDEGIVYKTKQGPANWVAKEVNEYINNGKLSSLTTDFMSDMASVFNGVRIAGGKNLPVTYQFLEGQRGTRSFKSLMKNNLKLMAINASSGGKGIQKLRDDPVFRGKFLTSKEVNDGREIIGNGDKDGFAAVMSQMQSATMLRQDGTVTPLFSQADIDSIYDVGGVDELIRVSKPAKLYFNKALDDTRDIVAQIRKPDSKVARDLKDEADLMVKYSSDLNPPNMATIISKGADEFGKLDSVRRGYIRNLKQKGVTGKNFDDRIRRYDKHVAKQTLEFIQTGAVKPVQGTIGTAAKPIPTAVDPAAMWKLLGGEKTTQQTRVIKTIFQRATGDDKLYDNLQAIAGLMNTRVPGASSGVNFAGIPRGLSVESYISRVYSMAREVVSFKYVATEAILQTMRMKNFNAFEAMIDNPEIAEHVVKIMKTGQPLTQRAETNFLQLMTNAVAKQVVKYESAEGSRLNPNAGEGFFSSDGDGVINNYNNYVKQGEEKGFLIGGINKEAFPVPGEGEYMTPNLKAITNFGQPSKSGQKFDIRKKPEFLGGTPDANPETLTGFEKIFGRVKN